FPRHPWHTLSWLVQGLIATGYDVVYTRNIDSIDQVVHDDHPKAIIVLARDFPAALVHQVEHAKKITGARVHLVQAHLYSQKGSLRCKGSIKDLSGPEVTFAGRHVELLLLGELVNRIGFTI
nr:hypothetical protein [Candidatus Sigynarchaeota archaeon]